MRVILVCYYVILLALAVTSHLPTWGFGVLLLWAFAGVPLSAVFLTGLGVRDRCLKETQ